MENWEVKLKLNQLQPRIFDNNPASIRGFSYEADGNLASAAEPLILSFNVLVC